jgi:hypothetical protein
MENRPVGESSESTGSASSSSNSSSDLSSVLDQIQAIARDNARAGLNSEKHLMLFLQSWWSRTYNRPLKDPILLSYTLEELLYEFYDRIERREAAEERLEWETDKMEEDKERADLDWAEQEEKKELEAIAAKAAGIQPDPTKDPANIKWMEEQMALAKKVHGDTFGEDIVDNFEGS